MTGDLIKHGGKPMPKVKSFATAQCGECQAVYIHCREFWNGMEQHPHRVYQGDNVFDRCPECKAINDESSMEVHHADNKQERVWE